MLILFCFVDHLCCFCIVMLSCTSVCWCLVVICWERTDLLAFVSDVWLWRCHFPIGILGQVWCLIVSIPNHCPHSSFNSYWRQLKTPHSLSLIFLAMLNKNEQQRTASLCRGWAMLENYFNLIYQVCAVNVLLNNEQILDHWPLWNYNVIVKTK